MTLKILFVRWRGHKGMCSLSVGECVVCAFATYVFIQLTNFHEAASTNIEWDGEVKSRPRRLKRWGPLSLEGRPSQEWLTRSPSRHDILPQNERESVAGAQTQVPTCGLTATRSQSQPEPNWLDQPAVCLSYSHLVQYLNFDELSVFESIKLVHWRRPSCTPYPTPSPRPKSGACLNRDGAGSELDWCRLRSSNSL